MKPLALLESQNAAQPLLADDVLEFHAARIMLLLRHCGVRHKATGQYRIQGLTKMAKLDFFVRYPAFFDSMTNLEPRAATQAAESPMIRYQYGPWDKRYYNLLSYLKARGLLAVEVDGQTVLLTLTARGADLADMMSKQPNFAPLLAHMKDVAKVFRSKSGNALKKLIYQRFDAEVGKLPWGEEISS